MQPVLEIRNLRKSFGSEIVIDDLSLAVPVHTATVLIGASGSGKSTLLRCINLLETIDDGAILLDGVEISDPEIDPDEVRRKLGMIFQSFNLSIVYAITLIVFLTSSAIFRATLMSWLTMVT